MSNAITHFPGHGRLFAEKYLEGKAEDRASLILRVPEKHGIDVPALTSRPLRLTSPVHNPSSELTVTT